MQSIGMCASPCTILLVAAGLDVPWTQADKLSATLDDSCRQADTARADAIAAHPGGQPGLSPAAASEDMHHPASMYGARQYGHHAYAGNVSPPATTRVAGSDRHASHVSSIETLLARMRLLEERIEQLEADNAERSSIEAKMKVRLPCHLMCIDHCGKKPE